MVRPSHSHYSTAHGQAAKEHELQQAVQEYETRLTQVTQSLAEFKHRAHTAEVRPVHNSRQKVSDTSLQLQLDESSTDSSRTEQLEKEVKEKNALIGKLRHEGQSTPYGMRPVRPQLPALQR